MARRPLFGKQGRTVSSTSVSLRCSRCCSTASFPSSLRSAAFWAPLRSRFRSQRVGNAHPSRSCQQAARLITSVRRSADAEHENEPPGGGLAPFERLVRAENRMIYTLRKIMRPGAEPKGLNSRPAGQNADRGHLLNRAKSGAKRANIRRQKARFAPAATQQTRYFSANIASGRRRLGAFARQYK